MTLTGGGSEHKYQAALWNLKSPLTCVSEQTAQYVQCSTTVRVLVGRQVFDLLISRTRSTSIDNLIMLRSSGNSALNYSCDQRNVYKQTNFTSFILL